MIRRIQRAASSFMWSLSTISQIWSVSVSQMGYGAAPKLWTRVSKCLSRASTFFSVCRPFLNRGPSPKLRSGDFFFMDESPDEPKIDLVLAVNRLHELDVFCSLRDGMLELPACLPSGWEVSGPELP